MVWALFVTNTRIAEAWTVMILNKKTESEIPAGDYQRALHAMYRVWMLTPQGETAQLVEYEMDQEALEEFVEDYTRFADLLVRIEVQDTVSLGNANSSSGSDASAP
jgi:hypothetical protein